MKKQYFKNIYSDQQHSETFKFRDFSAGGEILLLHFFKNAPLLFPDLEQGGHS